MYYPDLTPYEYLGKQPNPYVLNVGWLESGHPFPKGTIGQRTLEKLLHLCIHPVNLTRGFHISDLLTESTIALDYLAHHVVYENKTIALGDGEIRVAGRDGLAYAAPNLIYLYMKDLGYLPPAEFLEALQGYRVPSI